MTSAVKLLVARLRPTMVGWGFSLLPSSGGFIRRREHGFETLSWGSFTIGDQAVISPGLGVRHDQVDDLVNTLGHIWGEANRKNTTTVYRALDFFPFEPAGLSRITIDKRGLEAGVEAAANQVEIMMQTHGLAFLERYASVTECSRGLNQPIESRSHPLFNNFPLRAYYGLAAAAVAEPQRVQSLCEAYESVVRSGRIGDALAYNVGKGLGREEGVIFRLRYMADRTER